MRALSLIHILLDPKCHWALRHLDQFPVEVNRADKETLLRVPGIGVKSAARILSARRVGTLSFEGDVYKRQLQILTDSAKYDVACTSSGVDRGPKPGMLGTTAIAGICHSFSADGRCISLLKVLMSNSCIYDCCLLYTSRTDSPRAIARLIPFPPLCFVAIFLPYAAVFPSECGGFFPAVSRRLPSSGAIRRE